MMRWYCILLFFPVPALAQQFSAADIRQLKLYSTGVFSNKAQADTTVVANALLKVQPVWTKRKDGIWLFAERTDTAHHYQVWHFYLQDDTTLLMQLLDFKDSSKAAQLSSDIRLQTGLYLYHLITRHGCEIYLAKSKKGYAGKSSGKECFTDIPGIEYITFTMSFTRNGIEWQQKSFDKEDRELNSAATGNYTFTRQVKSLK